MSEKGSWTQSGTLRFGIIGAGMMGREHMKNLAALDGAEVVAVAEPDGGSVDRARRVAPGELAVFDDTESMLAGCGLDAVVVVASPNHTHHDVLDLLWATDLHLLIEKPLCTTTADCLAVRARASSHAGVVWMGLEYRYMPAIAEFLGRVRDGDAGRLRMVAIREHRFPFLGKIGDWNRFSRNTGGTLVEKCCHFFDLMNLVLDERPARVMASGAQDVNHLDERYHGETPDILDNAFVIVDYPSGARAMLDLCMFAEGSRWEQEVSAVGDAGKVEAFVPGFMEVARGREMETVVGSRGPDWPVDVQPVGSDPRVRYSGGHHGASYLELADFCEVIRTNGDAAVTVDDGVWSVAMGEAAHRSIDEGRPVPLSELGL